MLTPENSAPIRIQRRRTKGFNLQAQSPDGRPVVSVCRPGKWGNPFHVGLNGSAAECVMKYRAWLLDTYRWEGQDPRISIEDVRRELAGKHLACFCALDAPCHADVLLEILAKASPGAAAPAIERAGG